MNDLKMTIPKNLHENRMREESCASASCSYVTLTCTFRGLWCLFVEETDAWSGAEMLLPQYTVHANDSHPFKAGAYSTVHLTKQGSNQKSWLYRQEPFSTSRRHIFWMLHVLSVRRTHFKRHLGDATSKHGTKPKRNEKICRAAAPLTGRPAACLFSWSGNIDSPHSETVPSPSVCL